ncbi:MAG: hypothetical protein IPP26_04450 [Flavobacteriales bacterium]|nr:hypothetical protein [Flavobacteriales bacterium]
MTFVRLKKHFGQHFLKEDRVAPRIIILLLSLAVSCPLLFCMDPRTSISNISDTTTRTTFRANILGERILPLIYWPKWGTLTVGDTGLVFETTSHDTILNVPYVEIDSITLGNLRDNLYCPGFCMSIAVAHHRRFVELVRDVHHVPIRVERFQRRCFPMLRR